MKRRLRVVFLFFLFLPAVSTAQSRDGTGNGAAAVREAEDAFQEAIALFNAGDYEEAIRPLLHAKELYEALPPEQDISAYLALYLGISYYNLGEYEPAVPFLTEAVEEGERGGYFDVVLSGVLYLAGVRYGMNQYGEAFALYEEGLGLAEELGYSNYYPSIYNGMGDVSMAWGKYEDALHWYQKALGAAAAAGDAQMEIYVTNGTALAYYALGEYKKALEKTEQNIKKAEETNSPYLVSVLNTYGIVLMRLGRYDDAETAFLRGLGSAERTGNRIEAARFYVHLGGVYQLRENFGASERAYKQAMELFRDLDRPDDESVCLTNLGGIAYLQKQYGSAEEYFVRALELKEQLRLTAEGFDRVHYQSAQYHVYQYLVLTYMKQDKYAAAFSTLEAVNGRYLREQLGETGAGIFGGAGGGVTPEKEPVYRVPPAAETAIIAFAGTMFEEHAVIVITRDGYDGFVRPASEIAEAAGQYADDFPSFSRGVVTRGLKEVESSAGESSPLEVLQGKAVPAAEAGPSARPGFTFYDSVRLYRTALSSPAQSPIEEEARDELAREFYSHFIRPIEDALAGKEKLIIIPDGYLSFVPLETLRDDSGRYLIEEYDITYVQSMQTAELIRKREHAGLSSRSLIYGGALYEENMPDPELPDPEAEPPVEDRQAGSGPAQGRPLEQIRRDALKRLSHNESLLAIFAELGITGWSDLPGTFDEAKQIGRMFPGSGVHTGRGVGEEAIKETFSPDGPAGSYRFVHFALHGIVLPDIPEVSALVVTAAPGSGEDGYLTADEIRRLSIPAETVVLSACETGLGRLYGGEGVVGLAQALIQAGAGGVAVSLWQVSDEATKAYMTGLYELVREGMPFPEAASVMKRRFLKGWSYAEPFYWAPFVYYGR
jgi:CHAT domain-containing protein/Tfp pilus assembly protein PilF